MKILLIVFTSLVMFSCNSSPEKVTKEISKYYTNVDVVEKDSLLYFTNNDTLFSGGIIEKDSVGRIIKEIEYENGLKHGSEIHYEYFESDLAIVVLEGNWTDGKKSGIWKSHDGEGQMTVIKEYN